MKRFPCQLAVASFLVLFSLQSMAGLLINPKRIVLEERERAAALDLLNDGTEKARYQIYFEQKVMLPNGSIVDLEELNPDATYAKDLIRYSPRRVDIEPGARQTIRIAARRPKDLAEGEYVSHLVFKEIPIQEESSDKQEDEDLSVTLKPKLKIAIPIIVRKGTLSATAGVKEISFDGDEGKHGAFKLTLTREGSVSLYGSVEVYGYTDGVIGDRLAVSKGVGVYTEVTVRAVTVRLPQALNPEVKEFLIRFDEDEKYGGSNLVDVPFSLN
jgi:fimbrial chaperone protein